MVRVTHILLLVVAVVVVVTVHGSRGQDAEPSFTHLREYVNRNVQEFIQRALLESDQKHAALVQRALSDADEKHAAQIQRALLESDEKHAAQIASLRKENELLIQQVEDELSKKHADDIVTLRNELETQNRDLRMRLEIITHIVENQEKSRIINHQTNNNRETMDKYPEDAFGNTNRSLDETNGSSAKPMSSYNMEMKRNRNVSPISQVGGRNSVNGRQRGNMLERTGRQVTLENRVAFFATMEANNVHLGVNHDIVFQHAITNIGNAYNSHHGTFIAPVDGVYVFSCTLRSTSYNTWAHFMVNGSVMAKFDLWSNLTSWQSSQTIIVNLRQGYDVSVQNTDSDKIIGGDKYSTFSGFLLYEDLSNIPSIVG